MRSMIPNRNLGLLSFVRVLRQDPYKHEEKKSPLLECHRREPESVRSLTKMNQNITNLTFTYFMKENFTLFHYALGYIFYYLKPISCL